MQTRHLLRSPASIPVALVSWPEPILFLIISGGHSVATGRVRLRATASSTETGASFRVLRGGASVFCAHFRKYMIDRCPP